MLPILSLSLSQALMKQKLFGRKRTGPWLIHQAVESVSAESAEGWILNCGYSF